MKAIIMAGGEGTRLRPVTCSTPKPMAKIINKPVLEHIISFLCTLGINEIWITLRYMPEEIKNYFGSGKDFGVAIKYFVEDAPLGTAGSVAANLPESDFLVLSGDALFSFDLEKAKAFHKEKRAEATIILRKVDVPHENAVVSVDKSGKVLSFSEKPDWSRMGGYNVDSGIYILKPSVFRGFGKKRLDFSADVFPRLLKEGRNLFGFCAEGCRIGIDGTDEYRHCHYDFFDKKLILKTDAKEIEKGIFVSEGATVEKDAVLKPNILIGRNCHIKSGAVIDSYSCIGENTTVERGSCVKRSVILGGVHIGENCQIIGAVICDNVTIGNNAKISPQAVIGAGTVVGEGAAVNSGVKIWPHSNVEKNLSVIGNMLCGGKAGTADTVEKNCEREIKCTGEDKAKIIKRLLSEKNCCEIYINEGVEIVHPFGKAIIIPHPVREVCKVFTGSPKEEYAAELADFYVNKIENIINPI